MYEKVKKVQEYLFGGDDLVGREGFTEVVTFELSLGK